MLILKNIENISVCRCVYEVWDEIGALICHHDHTSHVSLTSKLYLSMFCGSLYKTLWSPLNTFLHCPPKLTVLITPALSLPVSMSYLQTFYTKFIELPHTNRTYILYKRYRVSLLMLTLFPPSQSWGVFYRGHMSALCHRGCSLFHPGHPHSPGLRYRPETGWYTDLQVPKKHFQLAKEENI